MVTNSKNNENDSAQLRSVYDPEPVAEEDLWFLPALPEDMAPTDMPWAVAARETWLDTDSWPKAEAAQYRELLGAVQAVTRFGERLKSFPNGVIDRFALISVCAVLKGEGVWLPPEQIALYRALRTGTDDTARDLARASWAVRRLTAANNLGKPGWGEGVSPLKGLHAFLGRSTVPYPQEVPGTDRPVGPDLNDLSDQWGAAVLDLPGVHPLTRAAFAYALWRMAGITPFEECLEPGIGAILIGADGLAPFLPLADGHRLDSITIVGGAGCALSTFYSAVRTGALNGLLVLDRLSSWQARATQMTADLSGRTPQRLIDVLLRLPVLSAELAAAEVGCSRPAARRNLALFANRGLIREVTGQERYRFWTIKA